MNWSGSREIGMKIVTSVASLLACAFSLDAQITTTVNRLPDGLEVTIRNNSAVSLAAFAISVNHVALGHVPLAAALRGEAGSAAGNSAPYGLYFDPAIEPAMPLPAGQERVVGAFRWLDEKVIAAGIFTDGATTGDAALLTRLMLRRSNMLLAVETALEALSNAGRQSIPRYQLIVQVNRSSEN
jgi:hypothetical protein